MTSRRTSSRSSSRRSSSSSRRSSGVRMMRNPHTGRMVEYNGVVGKQIRAERQIKRGSYKAPSHAGRGGETRGWRVSKPSTRPERRLVAKECGASKCFLDPKNLKYPVCPAISRSTPSTRCKPQRSGIISARVRSAQWHKRKINRKAIALERQYGGL